MNENLAPRAIKAALDGDWDLAIKLNQEILKNDEVDVEALNRLAKALSEKGKIKKAIEISKKVIKIDPFNKIACKCIERWKNLKEGLGAGNLKNYTPTLFIEEPGKTKIVKLINLSSQNIISTLSCADKVSLNLQGHRVSITTSDGKYIGRLPDDLGRRIKDLTSKGNVYEVLIKSADTDDITIFIKQTKTSQELEDFISFPSERVSYISFTPPELVHNRQVNYDEELGEETN